LAEILTHAERLGAEAAERKWTMEAKELLEDRFAVVQPEVKKIALALEAKRPRLWSKIKRVTYACDALSQSLRAAAWTALRRLFSAGNTLVRAVRRELKDVSASGCKPGIKGHLDAYSRLVCSAACEAFLELRPAPWQGRVQDNNEGMDSGDLATAPLPSSSLCPHRSEPPTEDTPQQLERAVTEQLPRGAELRTGAGLDMGLRSRIPGIRRAQSTLS